MNIWSQIWCLTLKAGVTGKSSWHREDNEENKERLNKCQTGVGLKGDRGQGSVYKGRRGSKRGLSVQICVVLHQ